MRRSTIIGLAAAAMLTLAACGSGETTSSSATTSTSTAPTAAASSDAPQGDAEAVSVPEQLQFTSKTTAGATFEGASLAGKPAVVWFWAPWCHVCKGEAPGVRDAAKSSGVSFLGVAALDDVEPMKGFVEEFDLDFPNLADTKAAVWARFGVTSQPSYAFISADGDIDVVAGALSASELDSRIAKIAG